MPVVIRVGIRRVRVAVRVRQARAVLFDQRQRHPQEIVTGSIRLPMSAWLVLSRPRFAVSLIHSAIFSFAHTALVLPLAVVQPVAAHMTAAPVDHPRHLRRLADAGRHA